MNYSTARAKFSADLARNAWQQCAVVPKWFDFQPRRGKFVWRANCTYSEQARKGRYQEKGRTMNPTAKPVKKNKKIEPPKKLERKTPLMAVRSLTVKW